MKKALGTVATYHGEERSHPRGHPVRIVAVMKNAARDDYDADVDGGHLTDEHDLVRRGGVTADDRVEVKPWIEAEGRYSFVTSDPRAIDLACFSGLARASR